jgi:hypothetical protein
MRRVVYLWCATAGCRGADEPAPPRPPAAEPVCPAPPAAGPVTAGDANGDGAVDLADAIYTERWLLTGGPAPACDGALDVFDDGVVDIGDGFAIFYDRFTAWRFTGEPDPCVAPPGVVTGPCGVVEVAFDAPRSAPGSDPIPVTVTVSSELAVQGWALSVKTSGCALASATPDGTVSADRRIDPAGLRDLGWEHTELVDGGAVSSVALSWRYDRSLPTGAASPVLALALDLPPPSTGCATCEVTLDDGLQGIGRLVKNLVVIGGQSYPAPPATATVQRCAGG